MIVIRLIAVWFALFALPLPLAAQDGYPNTCDPLQDCLILARYYERGRSSPPVFPKDVKRADALTRMGLDAVSKSCAAGNPDSCQYLAYDFFRFNPPQPTGIYSLRARLELAATATERQCAAGNPRACLTHIDLLNQRTDGISYGAKIAMQNGMSQADANAATQQKEEEFVTRARSLAAGQNTRLRAQCSADDQIACNDLGILLSWYADLRTSRYEHLPYLLAACNDASPLACNPLNKVLFEITTFEEADGAPSFAPWRNKLEQRCDPQHLMVCDILVLTSDASGSPDTDALAAKVCDMGSSTTCTEIGQKLLRAFAKTQNPETLGHATDVLSRACQLKEHLACHILEHISKG